ncbi:MAG: nitrile hydratase subunit beta [Acidiferrobacterales bacterium]|nr:nitrile hydratase subunit beta [Acidiferrobacterales bacterium]
MNGAHDLGGMDGFGPIDASSTPHFPNEWERQVFALTLACGFQGKWNLDQSRFAREQMEPGHYLTSTYYEHWLHGLEALLLKQGIVSEQELREGKADAEGKYTPVAKEKVSAILEKGAPVSIEAETNPEYSVGDQVRLINQHPTSHTRLPRYLRGRHGKIIHYHGAHIYPDVHSRDGKKQPAHLYTIAFDAAEVWGSYEAKAKDRIMVDVFEPYIEQIV